MPTRSSSSLTVLRSYSLSFFLSRALVVLLPDSQRVVPRGLLQMARPSASFSLGRPFFLASTKVEQRPVGSRKGMSRPGKTGAWPYATIGTRIGRTRDFASGRLTRVVFIYFDFTLIYSAFCLLLFDFCPLIKWINELINYGVKYCKSNVVEVSFYSTFRSTCSHRDGQSYFCARGGGLAVC